MRSDFGRAWLPLLEASISPNRIVHIMTEPTPTSMLERMTLILEAFDGHTTRLSLDEVVDATQLPRSTLARILSRLVGLRWLEHTAGGYQLGNRIFAIAQGNDRRTEIRSAAAPLMHDLQLRTGLVVHLTVLDRGDVIYLDKIGGRFASALPSTIGGRRRAYATAGGKSMLAFVAPEQIDGLYPEGLIGYTGHTITTRATLHRELDRIRGSRGLAFDRQESVRGIACIGAAVKDSSGPVAAISLCGALDHAHFERLAPLLIPAVREASRLLSSLPGQEAPERACFAPAPHAGLGGPR